MLRLAQLCLFILAALTLNAQSSFLEEVNIDPMTPTSFYGADDWAFFLHSRDVGAQYVPYTAVGDHGINCEPPVHLNPTDTYDTTHLISTYEDMVYNCKNHLMTGIRADGYGVINLMPNHLVDFSAGEAVISWDVSTENRSGGNRDWFTVAVMPLEDLNPMHAPDWAPDLEGHARNMLRIETTWSSGERSFELLLSDENFNLVTLPVADYATLEDLITPSKTVRTTFEIRISQNHVKLGMKLPAGHPSGQTYHWFVDTGVDPSGAPLNLSWNKGAVLFGHYSYNPRKDSGLENSWHWDNFSISPAEPFELIKADKRFADQTQPVLNFAGPSPANAKLIFAATDYERISDLIDLSFDGGTTWVHANRVTGSETDLTDTWGASYVSYSIDIPAGISSVEFRGVAGLQNWMARDVYVIAPAGLATCATPTNPSVTAVSASNVNLFWDPVAEASAYELQGRKVGGAAGTRFTTLSSPFITGLQAASDYQWRVRSICGATNSPWTAVVNFSTPAMRAAADHLRHQHLLNK